MTDDPEAVCANASPFPIGQSYSGALVTPDDIDPYRFEVTQPYTTIVATLTPPTSGDFDLYLFDGCDGSVEQHWDSGGRRLVNIGGRRLVNIGGDEDPNIYVRYNVGKQTGTYYLAVRRLDGGIYSGEPYQLRVDLQAPNFAAVDTLLLYNSARMREKYGLAVASQIMDALVRLSAHSQVNGLIIQLNQFPAVAAAYDNWDNTLVLAGNEQSYLANVAAANDVSDHIRVAMREYMLETGQYITDTGYVVLIGDDDQIPFQRLDIQPSITCDPKWKTGQEYFLSLGDPANTPLDAALMANQTLSDNCYGDYQDRGNGPLPSLMVGRLLDPPLRIQNTIESFLKQDGVIALAPPQPPLLGKASVAGYAFLMDVAQAACASFQTVSGLSVDCSLINNSFTAEQLFQKFITDRPELAGFYGHMNHDQLLATPGGGVLTASQIANASFGPTSSLWWGGGCQSGLALPHSENYPLSLAQALGDQGVTDLHWEHGLGLGIARRADVQRAVVPTNG